jgi:phospholipase C
MNIFPGASPDHETWAGPMRTDRRSFLKLGASAALLPLALQKVLAAPMKPRTGTIQDVEHVVIFMQENRSFDHYFGTLSGVRGFDDPRAITLPSGKPVWQQPGPKGDVGPFHLDTKTTFAQGMKSLDHSWKGSHALWKNHDAWIPTKTELTMGYFTRPDLPFYYALADAFTICDAYHCSIFGPTSPNRMFLVSGTSGLSVGDEGDQVASNPPEENETADIAADTKSLRSFDWTTYAERLQAAGIDWRVYQEFDNYGDNALALFTNFRGGVPRSELHERARGCAPGSNAGNAKTSRGEHLVAAFAADVQADRLPQVSWIVAPYIMCEHPTATPGYGESLTARLLEALAARPEVWAKTAFILNYDENDGFFDHVPPMVPPVGTGVGTSTVDTTGELYKGEPVGFGPRVPLIIVSPWTRGGFVNSELSDHTSAIRFLEKRFGVMEPNITTWRRALAGDLTSMFDFAQSDAWSGVAGGDDGVARADAQAKLPAAVRLNEAMPRQEPGQRPARPLAYDFDAVWGPTGYTLLNRGKLGAGFRVVPAKTNGVPHNGPWFDTVAPGHSVSSIGGGEFSVYGPNGYFRQFRIGGLAATLRADGNEAVLSLANPSDTPVTVAVRDGYSAAERQLVVEKTLETRWPLAANDHWYDLTVRGPDVQLQLAGHFETGKPSKTDPLIGRA